MGALPFLLRELDTVPPVYGGPLTAAMVRSKLDEHKLKDTPVEDVLAGQTFEAGPFSIEMVKMAHSIPDAFAVALTSELGTMLMTGDYKFDQTPVDGVPADVSRLAELGRDRLLLLCGDSTNADRPGVSLSESSVGPRLCEVFGRCEGRIVVTCFASNIHRVQQVVDAAAAQARKVSLIGRSMRKNTNIGRMLGHINIPDGLLVGPKEIEDFPDHKLVVISTGSQGEPLSALRRMAHGDHPQRGPARWRHRDLLGHGDPRERAGRERDDRPHLQAGRQRDHRRRRASARLRSRLRGGAQADAQPHPAAVRDAGARGPQAAAAARGAGRGGRDRRRSRSSAARTDYRSRSTPPAPAGASASRRASSSWTAWRWATSRTWPCATAGCCRRTASSSSSRPSRSRTAARSSPPEIIFRGVPFADEADGFVDELRVAVDKSLAHSAEEQISEIDLLQDHLHDDIAAFVYDRLKRRPMVLPVVVEV